MSAQPIVVVAPVGLAFSAPGRWQEVDGHVDPSRPVVRLRAANLRHATSETQRIRADARRAGVAVRVFVDLDAHVRDVASAARRDVLEADVDLTRDSIRYVGTPTGLVGLIRDIGLAAVADGVTLLPLLPQTVTSRALVTLVAGDRTSCGMATHE